VCSVTEGTVFELTNILPFLKKHGVNPATGSQLQGKDLLRVNFFKNQNGKCHDPVSFKEFNEHSHIVVIKTSGNVFAYDTVQQLNTKAKYWHDLVDDTEFTRKDLITLQDPHNVEGRDVSKLHHLQKGLKWDVQESKEEEVNASATGSAGKLLLKMREAKEAAKRDNAPAGDEVEVESSSSSTAAPLPSKAKVPYNATNASTGMMAASFTSSSLSVQTKSERQLVNEEEYMFEKVAAGEGVTKGKGGSKGKTKAFVRMETNFGPLSLELHVDKAPKTCYNFLELCREGKYTDTIFHRNIKGFMIQGGDPTGTGRGGESIWGKPFRDEFDVQGAFRHTQRGTLSMANKGPATNGSQFFFSYREKLPHLDAKHTVFGRLLADEDGRLETLDKMEAVPNEPGSDRPMRSIRILQVYVLENPFDDWKENLQRRLARENVTEAEQKQRLEKKKRKDDDRTTWLGTNLGTKGNQQRGHSDQSLSHLTNAKGQEAVVGRYLDNRPVDSHESSAKRPKTKASSGFGDFSSW
jgi:peptidyl-prolyl cis-trans isomerase-like protein 2